MASLGPGPQYRDPSRIIRWKSEREMEVALAAGLRVVRHGALGIQVQTLELLPGGAVRIASVAPGDGRHLALWNMLMKPEKEWGNE